MSDDLVWNERPFRGSVADPDSKTSRSQYLRVRARHMQADDVERLRVNRDPCFWCGVRMDMHEGKCG